MRIELVDAKSMVRGATDGLFGGDKPPLQGKRLIEALPQRYFSGGGAETLALGAGLSAVGGAGGVLWRESVGGAARL